jgi:hypothetical protein
MARSLNALSTGRIQKRKTNLPQITIFGLQRAAGPYRWAITGHQCPRGTKIGRDVRRPPRQKRSANADGRRSGDPTWSEARGCALAVRVFAAPQIKTDCAPKFYLSRLAIPTRARTVSTGVCSKHTTTLALGSPLPADSAQSRVFTRQKRSRSRST